MRMPFLVEASSRLGGRPGLLWGALRPQSTARRRRTPLEGSMREVDPGALQGGFDRGGITPQAWVCSWHHKPVRHEPPHGRSGPADNQGGDS